MIQEQNPSRQQVPWPVKNMNNLGDNYAEGPRIKVRCIDQRGLYYNFLRRREGDVFELIPQYVTVVDVKSMKPVMENGKVKMKLVTAEEQFSEVTMERIEDPNVPERITTAQQSLNAKQDELNESKRPARSR